jgi:hypothetical protein
VTEILIDTANLCARLNVVCRAARALDAAAGGRVGERGAAPLAPLLRGSFDSPVTAPARACHSSPILHTRQRPDSTDLPIPR